VTSSLVCVECRHWDEEHLAYPDAIDPGSKRVCRKGHETHHGSWRPCWERRTAAQLLEAAHAAGRLF